MDSYNLKKENRKKFSENQRSKNRHATQSDRKYKAINKQKQQQQQQLQEKEKEGQDTVVEEKEPPSNAYRYHEDIDLAFEELLIDDNDNLEINKKLKNVLNKRVNNDDTDELLEQTKVDKPLTKKMLDNLDIKSLNNLLKPSLRSLDNADAGREHLNNNKDANDDDQSATIEQQQQQLPSPRMSNERAPNKTNAATSNTLLPSELTEEQSFLDSLL
ncbi:uncharacterized protein NDAI_0B06070 [Naumovozyma dairenensis CBS 421]|uniref:Uncharacterized protein n=1 Tax=Naumovozyma dairenensis (strain ATCC 10597 / BCRC 20456 / CBS 421 / NBRC 0211 / NRRL Y-12639) TaxID=1071378 RepID=G0W778_NAUDC|nr:hypothetical protein NDAI_0B06070 [Naumovozyma dairenensis CBS 421]CCD23639.1 hypothetical protein NDAI_0B06070 [Naumovozyma dairenensis CBS 421]